MVDETADGTVDVTAAGVVGVGGCVGVVGEVVAGAAGGGTDATSDL